jgi:hypothetical protein
MEGVERKIHSFLIPALQTDYLYVPALYPTPSGEIITGLDDLQKRKMSCLRHEPNHNFHAVQLLG